MEYLDNKALLHCRLVCNNIMCNNVTFLPPDPPQSRVRGAAGAYPIYYRTKAQV